MILSNKQNFLYWSLKKKNLYAKIRTLHKYSFFEVWSKDISKYSFYWILFAL